MKIHYSLAAAAAGVLALTGVAAAQTPTPVRPINVASAPVANAPPSTKPQSSQAPTSLSVYFATGSATISPEGEDTLDEASRVFNDGKPIVMIITGMADATGAPGPNLLLSQRRADAVFAGLVARGLPPAHFQILAQGDSDVLADKAPAGPDQSLRKVEITWR